MWAMAFGTAGMVAGIGGLVFALRRDRRDVSDRRQQIKVEGQHEGEKLSDFVVRQTETVIRGWEGVNRELQERAEVVVRELEAVTAERNQLLAANEELRARVNTLETNVATLKGQADADRATIHALQREVASLKGAS